jgi:hypothetical protein
MNRNRAAATAIAAILKIVEESGPNGAPAGPMYAAMMTVGCTLEQFQGMMGTLVAAGLLRLSHHCYFLTPKAQELLKEARTTV